MGSKQKKVSGILMPLSALPGPYGIGDCGSTAWDFVDWLRRAKQHRWQVLPLTIPDSTGSPYASLSGEAGNWLFISPDQLLKQGFLPKQFKPRRIQASTVPYRLVMQRKWQLILTSYRHFSKQGTWSQQTAFRKYCHSQATWLDDYILFQALKDRHQQRPWWTWEQKWRRPILARRHLDQYLKKQMQLHAFAQWLFAEQWDALHRYANRQGVKIIGDLPFYIRTDSVDVWAHPELFLLNRRGLPTVVAGVPPDYFARDGQRWGNPLYRWSAHQRTNWQWWTDRIQQLNQRCDIIRFDHFRGLVQTWQIPVTALTARRGRWVTSPGISLLRTVKRRIRGLPLIAEDLGNGTMNADHLRRTFHLPTIRVLLFGWNGLPQNSHDVRAITPDSVYYTSNHDTNTIAGWWQDEAKKHERKNLRGRLPKVSQISWQAIALAWSTPATTTITAVQDILSLGSDARFNHPGRRRGNWAWRLRSKQLTNRQADRLAKLTLKYGRA